MPPKKRPRPDPKDAAAVTQWLHALLHESSLQTQRKQGRVVLRRLNRTEYETTLRDLLAAVARCLEAAGRASPSSLPSGGVASGR